MKPKDQTVSKSYGCDRRVLTFAALSMLVACGPQHSNELNRGETNLADLAVRDLWVEDFSDTSLSTIVTRSSVVPPDTKVASCHAQIAVPTDERIPHVELRQALTSSVDPFPEFYNEAYRQEVPLTAEDALLLTTYDERAEWLVQQSVIVSRYVELRLVDEILASFQRTLARYNRLSDNIDYWENQNMSVGKFNSDKEMVRAFTAASKRLPAQLTNIKAECLEVLSQASGIRKDMIYSIIENTWTQQPSPLPGISPLVPAELLNKRPDIAFAQDIITEASVLNKITDSYSFGLSGTISSNEVKLSSQPLARKSLDISGLESSVELFQKQKMFMLVETWGGIAARASEDISHALGEYEALSENIHSLEKAIQNLENDLSDEFARFDGGLPRPRSIASKTREIQNYEIQIAGMRAEYAKLWAFLNTTLGHGRSPS